MGKVAICTTPRKKEILVLSVPAARQLWERQDCQTEAQNWQHTPLLVLIPTNPSSPVLHCSESGANALERPPSGKPGADLHAFRNGVRGHLGGDGQLGDPVACESTATRGARAEWVTSSIVWTNLAVELRSPSRQGPRERLGCAGRRPCPRGGSGRRRPVQGCSAARGQ